MTRTITIEIDCGETTCSVPGGYFPVNCRYLRHDLAGYHCAVYPGLRMDDRSAFPPRLPECINAEKGGKP